jgi:hypothetical protein
MSSHREAPEISKDPVADSTDLYAFVSPDKPDTVTLIANYVPLQAPAGGPNFYEFGDDVLYEIRISHAASERFEISYEFRFTSVLDDPNTFLYNTGPIAISNGTLNTSSWNRRQFFSVTRVGPLGKRTVLAENLACPPCNIGPLSTPDYAPSSNRPDPLTRQFIHALPTGETVFAGQRAEGFYVDLGTVFDLGNLRPIANDHNTFGLNGMLSGMPGVNTTAAVNVHSIAIQVPKSELTIDGSDPVDSTSAKSVIGVYTTASRQRIRLHEDDGSRRAVGPHVQVSRMANPLFNEVLVPLVKKDQWNASSPYGDAAFAAGVTNPELGQLLPVLFTPDGSSTVFPHLAAYNAQIAAGHKSRADLAAILLTGLPAGVVPGFQNSTGATQADLLRLNMAIAPATTALSNLGVVGGDLAGFPNGRRVFDDVANIELKAIAGATIGLVDPTYVADAAVALVDEGLTKDASDTTAKGTIQYLTCFPYLGTPHSGYFTPQKTPVAVPPAAVAS